MLPHLAQRSFSARSALGPRPSMAHASSHDMSHRTALRQALASWVQAVLVSMMQPYDGSGGCQENCGPKKTL